MNLRFPVCLIFLFLGISVSFAQTGNSIKDSIQSDVRAVNQTPGMNRVEATQTFKLAGEDVEGRLTGFYENTNLRKMVGYSTNKKGRFIEEYYFVNDRLAYAHEWFYSYTFDKVTGEQLSSSQQTFDGQYYFQNGRLADRETQGENPLIADSDSLESSLLQRAAANRDALDKANPDLGN